MQHKQKTTAIPSEEHNKHRNKFCVPKVLPACSKYRIQSREQSSAFSQFLKGHNLVCLVEL